MESKGQKPSLVRTLTDRKKLEMIGDNISGLFYLDGQLGARKD